MSNNLPLEIQNAIDSRAIDNATWNTLKNSVFPGAKDESIILAIDYCKARKLDILKKPCHIVPMNVRDAQTGSYYWKDVIMPSIYEQRITAFRTQQMAGEDDPVFGDTIDHLGIQVPEWCKVTVYRFINGEKCAFSHTEYFIEACSTTSDKNTGELRLNSMWSKRPRGQLAKCAEAGALRKAFPDELGGVITSDEATEDIPAKNQVIEAEVTVKSELTDAEVQHLENLLKQSDTEMKRFFSAYAVESIYDLTRENYEKAIKQAHIKLERLKQAQQPADNGQEVAL